MMPRISPHFVLTNLRFTPGLRSASAGSERAPPALRTGAERTALRAGGTRPARTESKGGNHWTFSTLKHLKSAHFSMKNGSFRCFWGLSVMLFHANMERMTFRPWHHIIQLDINALPSLER